MKYTCSIDIDKPIEEVIRLFDNPDNLKYWQPGLLSYEHISGTPGQPGARAKLHYKMGKRDIEMIETVVKRDLPHEFTGTYETNGVVNISKNIFEPINEKRTRYTSEQEFKLSGFMKIMGWLMPGSFQKESDKYLKQFKEFVESK
ncbi:SRPBCC family protein [Fulvivirga sedimenti]|uniref:SRPBCC family protein n=1 Tax=Fulvivirga sedimenti TaxID=2879465 RepID=A0A9X1HKS1_9BACT|nr:SRPBCC family protein [Fulvivirga sedimenti]MCA6073701.1 SRPBCC family protein [Fulvivirga sedimenti]